MRSSILLVAVLLACLCLALPAQAAILYELTDAIGTEQDSFVVGSVGQTVEVGVYLKQIGGILTDEGLFSAGVRLTYSLPGVAEVLSALDVTPNPAFDDPTALLIDIDSGYVTLDMAVLDFLSPVFPKVSTPDRIWLGTFKFTGLNSGSVQIAAMDNPDLDNTLTGFGTPLDLQIESDQGTVTVFSTPDGNQIPEPSSLVLVGGLFGMAGLCRSARRLAATK